jgi:C-terminal processing protease CtpA/Prc
MGFLKKYDLFFNRDDKKLYYKFINDKDTPIIVENKPISGILRIDIDFQTFEIIIAEIIENSPSFNAGLRLNDRISAINNYTISELSIDSVINMLRSENISLDVKRDSGKEKLSFFIEKIF